MIDEIEFERIVGAKPVLDELDRANCPDAGTLGHMWCGMCEDCKKPRFACGHRAGEPHDHRED